MKKPEVCELCGRPEQLTKHHLIPQCRLKNVKKMIRILNPNIIWICRPCHSNIHAVLSEKELETHYNTKRTLLSHPDVRKFVNWIGKKQTGLKVPIKKKKKRR